MMMRTAEIQAWVQRFAERTRAGHQEEQSSVELKAGWERPEDAALRIAGHANAARGEPVLWVIGLDPKGNAVPTDHSELAHWWPNVQRHFDDGVAPSMLHHVVVPLDGGNVVALLFDTEAAPFVIKCSDGTTRVPFREGLRVSGIRRRQLVQMLAPTVRVPSVELLYARFVAMGEVNRNGTQPSYGWRFVARLYVVPNGGPVHFPAHRQHLRFKVGRLRIGGRPVVTGDDGTIPGDAAVTMTKPSWLYVRDEGTIFDQNDWEDADRVVGDILVGVEGLATKVEIPFKLSTAFKSFQPPELDAHLPEKKAWTMHYAGSIEAATPDLEWISRHGDC
jgi:hypothetical protein